MNEKRRCAVRSMKFVRSSKGCVFQECMEDEHCLLGFQWRSVVANLLTMSVAVESLSERQMWLRELSCALPAELELLAGPVLAKHGTDVLELRRPEVGLTMVTGRVGGTGEAFGLGEMTVTRCVVQVDANMGVGYVRGRDTGLARTIALLDALLQGPHAEVLRIEVIQPLAETRLERAAQRAEQTASTRVQFLTMVRGN